MPNMNPYGALMEGIAGGANAGVQNYANMRLMGMQLKQKAAQAQQQQDIAHMKMGMQLLADKNVPDSIKLKTYNSMTPVWNKYFPESGMTEISEWPQHGNEYAAKALKIWNNKEYDIATKKQLIAAVNLEAQSKGQKVDLSAINAIKGPPAPKTERVLNKITGEIQEIPAGQGELFPDIYMTPEQAKSAGLLKNQEKLAAKKSADTLARQKEMVRFNAKMPSKKPAPPPEGYGESLANAINALSQGHDQKAVYSKMVKAFPSKAKELKTILIDSNTLSPEAKSAVADATSRINGGEDANMVYREVASKFPKESQIIRRILLTPTTLNNIDFKNMFNK